ncbi:MULTISPECIES: NAD(P)/FAD-dependent oxidoreductase [unclassified Rhizobium]|jgi:cation diffusion facilitator CzcD-associated flavoprotein CzcO|uniref:flavin-containing monooxygenase n=1 Tax=unclassified Rhizobium TaxID=2613769 RepID=UPI001C83519F|nr:MULTISPECIES: NAD(P)/FAD-dependent oxidoreductase [unclassified Rhizobium]MBX5159066.1 NAD(P)/FAD-dependent oxidoreductase [Rhizobium sp. NZLR8]MBX5165466.1 NAD(P)/FAD-dependent oxidoreductase [Rhizobium sp. NZLR4b]MBX5174677.1 NAD(P)/FAD-dependent oxidoreductase [Rhizobium sp. NZLR1b]MBX5212574.1 NAD(P)/FAD-dependent oxidoreductase [Rhizobium sp. NZLR11]
MESLSQIERAVIVGAGLAGLAVAYHLKQRGVNALLLDRGEALGSSWRARHPQLTLNTHRSVSHLPGLKFPPMTPAFPKRDDVVRHLDDFARHHAFRINYGADVTSIRQSDGNFEISVSGDIIKAANVIVATGRDREPVEPAIQGSETFSGIRLHAAAFGDAKQYRGKRVLVVGGGNSGFDVVNHLCRVPTAQIWLSVRSGSAILPKRLKGIAVHRLSPLMDLLPSSASDLAIKITERLAFGDIRKLGLPEPAVGAATRLRREHVAIPVDDGAIQSLKDGRTEIVGEVVRIAGGKVLFADGGMAEPDYLITATGYSSGLKKMLSDLDVLDERGNPLIGKNGADSGIAGFWFAGMTPGLVSYFYSASREAKALARAITKR